MTRSAADLVVDVIDGVVHVRPAPWIGCRERPFVRELGAIPLAISAPAPIDVFVTDEPECARRRDVIGSMHYWPLREGKVVHERAG